MAEPLPAPTLTTYERGPTSSEMATWDRLLAEHQRAWTAIHVCDAIWQNAIIAAQFAAEQGVSIETIPAALEQRYLNVRQNFSRLTRAIRGAEDHTLGVRFRDGDVDIMATDLDSAQEQGFGAVVLIIAGVVVVAAAIGVAYWATQNALEISMQARAIVQKADRQFCADPSSALCSEWKNEKKTTVFEKNETLADTIKSGISRVGGGLVIGLIALIAVGLFWRKK
jgi:hypothetical protein